MGNPVVSLKRVDAAIQTMRNVILEYIKRNPFAVCEGLYAGIRSLESYKDAYKDGKQFPSQGRRRDGRTE